MLTHYKGTCRPAQTSGPPPSTLSLGRERLLTYYSPARALASFTAYTYTGSARLRNPLPDPDHESLEALRNEGPARSISLPSFRPFLVPSFTRTLRDPLRPLATFTISFSLPLFSPSLLPFSHSPCTILLPSLHLLVALLRIPVCPLHIVTTTCNSPLLCSVSS